MKTKCNTCSHWQNYDGNDRCSYYHDSLCEYVERYCNGRHYMDKDEGLSLYAFRSWLKRLDHDEMELPLVFEEMGSHNILTPILVVRTVGADFDKWVFHSKRGDDY